MMPDGSLATPEDMLAAAGVSTTEATPTKRARRRRLHVLTLADCAAAAPRGYIVKGLIAPGDLAVLFGPPGAGKSVVAPYIAHAIAAGRGVFGRRVRHGVVLYVAAEDGAGMKLRAKALRGLYGDTGAFRIVAEPIDLMGDGLRDTPDLAELRAVAQRIGATVIWLDTLAAAFPGLDENEGGSMGRAVKVLRDLGAPAEADGATPAWPGAAVVAVHHPAKGGGTTPRGHGVLDGEADVTMRIDVPEDRGAPRTVKLGKNRNGSSLDGFAFTIRAEVLGEDEDGDPITAPVAVEEVEAGGSSRLRRPPKLPEPAALLLRELQTMVAEGAGEAGHPLPGMPQVHVVPRDLLRSRLVRNGWFAPDHVSELLPDCSPGNERLTRGGYRAENKALNTLKLKGCVGFQRERVWLA